MMSHPKLRALDIGLLRTFDALMRERSVSRAASVLFLSQSAASASLARLREVFNDPLFTRTSSGVTPTPLALTLADGVARVLKDINRLLETATGFDPSKSERIFRLSGSDYSGRFILTPLVTKLLELNSRLRIYWDFPAFSNLAERIHRGAIDLAVAPEPSMRDAGLKHAVLFDEHFVLVSRRNHPAFVSGDILAAYTELPHVLLGFRDPGVDELLEEGLRDCDVRVRVPGFQLVADLVASTDMISIFPSQYARSLSHVLDAHQLPVDFASYKVGLYWDRRTEDDAGLTWLRHQLVQIASANYPSE